VLHHSTTHRFSLALWGLGRESGTSIWACVGAAAGGKRCTSDTWQLMCATWGKARLCDVGFAWGKGNLARSADAGGGEGWNTEIWHWCGKGRMPGSSTYVQAKFKLEQKLSRDKYKREISTWIVADAIFYIWYANHNYSCVDLYYFFLHKFVSKHHILHAHRWLHDLSIYILILISHFLVYVLLGLVTQHPTRVNTRDFPTKWRPFVLPLFWNIRNRSNFQAKYGAWQNTIVPLTD
jgi:hypothetical protein